MFQALRQENREASILTFFYSLVSSAQRRAVFARTQEGERRELASEIKREIVAAGRMVEQGAARDFAKLRTEYLAQCSRLKATQDNQRAELRAGWRTRNSERRQALAPFKQRVAGMRQGQQQGRGRTIRDDDRFRQPPKRREPGLGPG